MLYFRRYNVVILSVVGRKLKKESTTKNTNKHERKNNLFYISESFFVVFVIFVVIKNRLKSVKITHCIVLKLLFSFFILSLRALREYFLKGFYITSLASFFIYWKSTPVVLRL